MSNFGDYPYWGSSSAHGSHGDGPDPQFWGNPSAHGNGSNPEYWGNHSAHGDGPNPEFWGDPSARGDGPNPEPPATNSASTVVSKILQNGLTDTVQELVRMQVEQIVGSTSRHKGDSNRSLAGTDKLDPFDPDSPHANIDRWILRFDELGEEYDWSDFKKLYLLKTKLCGRARDWYVHMDSNFPGFLWDDWKKALWDAFMVQDFAINLEELLARRKRSEETLSQYFKEKMILCARCNFSGEEAVSCVIHGLPKELRARARAPQFRSPEKLFSEFIQVAEMRPEVEFIQVAERRPGVDSVKRRYSSERDEYGGSLAESGYGEEDLRAQAERPTKMLQCFYCKEFTNTHKRSNCPKKKKVPLKAPPRKCFTCGETGHERADCLVRKHQRLLKEKGNFFDRKKAAKF